MPTKRERRLVRGKDWHFWTKKLPDGTFLQFVSYTKPSGPGPKEKVEADSGKWVRVKFGEVDND